ncbi:sugar-binding transcriptional regulator [Methylobacterium sp. SyP6R]|uniref:sugar-binding transcriptional regulator n=1 Tax=Methylobacterium sp. SyP6R TaxID=2718876 RepID=UPI001F28A3BC|nr:sugar-binding transcriptional regulator [Methylobacterium sp. SyP6R]MCF4129613.1 sugar-binding transcriptional regulator [Methylobacterium sp. SyP6R]
MSRADDLRLITRIAQMYYIESRKQSDISEILHIPQARVSRLLKRALDENIVRITISSPPGVFADLEARIRDRYGLDDVIITESASQSEDSILAAIGGAAAHFLETTIADDEVIGMSSWSSSLLRMVDAITPIKRAKAKQVVQIMGGIGSPAVQSHAQHLVTRMAQLTGAKAQFLPAPGVAGSAESRAVLLRDPFVAETVACFSSLTLAFVGIGSMTPSLMLANSGNAFTRQELDELAAQGAVGDMGLRFFDGSGAPVITPLNDRVISIPLDQIKASKRVVGVAGGLRKIPAITAALNGGYLDVLITDHATAEHLAGDVAGPFEGILQGD